MIKLIKLCSFLKIVKGYQPVGKPVSSFKVLIAVAVN